MTNDITAESIYIKIPQVVKEIITNSLILKNQDANEEDVDENDTINLSLKIETKFLIYVINNNRELYDLENEIRVEFLGNILPQKLHLSIINLKSSRLEIPNDTFLNYFGFFIRLSSYQDKESNELTVSKSNYKFLLKVLSSFYSFTKIKLSKKIEIYLAKFLSDVKNLAKYYYWGKN